MHIWLTRAVVRRVTGADLGGSVSAAELRDTHFAIAENSESKRNFAYVHENVFRHAIPAFEKAVLKYTEEVVYFGRLSTLCIYINVTVNALLLGGMAFSVSCCPIIAYSRRSLFLPCPTELGSGLALPVPDDNHALCSRARAAQVLSALRGVVQDVQHKYVLCRLALVLPRDTIHKMYHFYRTVEEQLILVDDEDAEKQA